MHLINVLIVYQPTIETQMSIDPVTRQIFKYATPVFGDKNSQNSVALDLDNDEHFVRIDKFILRAALRSLDHKNFDPLESQRLSLHMKLNLIQCWFKKFL